MNCYSPESAFIDSLNFLNRPAHGNQNRRKEHRRRIDKTLILQARPNKADVTVKETQRTVSTGVGSSLSLVLKKASAFQILKKYQAESSTTLQIPHNNNTTNKEQNNNIITTKRLDSHKITKDKPLIEVTVISTDKSQKARTRKKRRSVPKELQNTLSDQDNSIQTKDLYLEPRRKKDKVHESKSTGNTILSSDKINSKPNKHEGIAKYRLLNIKSLIQSLNMDQGKSVNKKDVKELELHRKILIQENTEYESPNIQSRTRSPDRDRVRIYGQLGLTDDDRYVLKYGAMVNDKPVSDCTHITQEFLSNTLTDHDASIPTEQIEFMNKKDLGVQTSSGRHRRSKNPSVLFGTESQGTQVNFNVQVTPRKNYEVKVRDKNIQCNCNPIKGNEPEAMAGVETCPKGCQSPLVIISVYPKLGLEDDTTSFKTPKREKDGKRSISPSRINTTQAQLMPRSKIDTNAEKGVMNTKRDNSGNGRNVSTLQGKRLAVGRSPSPIRNTKLKTQEKEMEEKVLKNQTNKKLPERRPPSPMRNVEKFLPQEKQIEARVAKTSADRNYGGRSKEIAAIKHAIPEKDRIIREVPRASKFRPPLSRQGISNQATPRRSRSPTRSPSPTRSLKKGTTTELTQAKKKNIDKTKKLSEPWHEKYTIPNNSKVKINIDGENEYYDVLFDRSDLTTDLRIRKTMKDIGSQKSDGRPADSLANLFMYSGKDEMIPLSIKLFNKPSDEILIPECNSVMAIRDSLEITHRREDKRVSNIKSAQALPVFKQDPDITNFLAPIKHYTGDDCSICDPVERDKQIRELLGVKKSINSHLTSQVSTKEHFSENDDRYLWIYRTECEKNQEKDVELMTLCRLQEQIQKGACRPYRNVLKKPTYTKSKTSKTIVDEQNYDKQSANYEQLVLNRNIRIFLQVEQFYKQKPLILSRKQYEKVKRAIQNTISNKYSREKRKHILKSSNSISVEETSKKLRNLIVQNQNIQTSEPFCNPNRRNRLLSEMKSLPPYSTLFGRDDRVCEPYLNNKGPVVNQEQQHKDIEIIYGLKNKTLLNKNQHVYNKDVYLPKDEHHKSRNKDNRPKCQCVPSDCQCCGEYKGNADRKELKANQYREFEEIYSIARNPLKSQFKLSKGINLKEIEGFDELKLKYREQNRQYHNKITETPYQETSTLEQCHTTGLSQRVSIPHHKSRKRYHLLKQNMQSREHNRKKDDLQELSDKHKNNEYLTNNEYNDTISEHERLEETEKSSEKCDADLILIAEPLHHPTECSLKECNDSKVHEVLKNSIEPDSKSGDLAKTLMLNTADDNETLFEINDRSSLPEDYSEEKSVSEVEMHYTSVSVMKAIDQPTSNLHKSDCNLNQVHSFRTIFRGKKKTPTPNLGTSEYSYSDEGSLKDKSMQCVTESQDLKPNKKPFLRRLMSCLVMRSARASDLKLPVNRVQRLPSINSTFDSYHINTSLGGVEVTSSLYDTSASFYSNHTVLAINTKMKRGFFSSVRGFLTNRRS